MADPDLRHRLDEFVAYRKNHLDGDEKGEAQVFLDRLFQAFGHLGTKEAGAVPETRLRDRVTRRVSFADLVWKPRVLIEMKKSGEQLSRHYDQAFEYWLNLTPQRTDYVVLCNFDEFYIYDLNRQLEDPVDIVALDDLSRRWEALGFLLPTPVEPTFGNDLVAVTREAAATVVRVANSMIDRGVPRADAQRFTMQSVVAMFAEDTGLLPTHLFTKALEDSAGDAGDAYDLVFGLFREMNIPGVTPGGRYKGTRYFNGTLFAQVSPSEITTEELVALHHSASHDWSEVRPEIFGTLFEQSMGDPARRALGAHFTSGADIQRVVLPTIVTPWRDRIESASSLAELSAVENDLLTFRVLDPACGCGNFLYVAYRELRKLEARIHEKERRLSRGRKRTGTRLSLLNLGNFLGIDIDPFAVEIAKVTMLLGKQLANVELSDLSDPLPLDDLNQSITAGDALFMDWPSADAIVGNPPYIGRRYIIQQRGADYAARLDESFPEVGGVSDYVSYWYRLAHDHLPDHGRAGLVGTNTIRQGDSRIASLDYITSNGGKIVDAWSSLPWSGDANVHVSIVNWTKSDFGDQPVLRYGDEDDDLVRIEPPLIAGHLGPGVDVGHAVALRANKKPKRLFQGQTVGNTEAFVIDDPREAERLVAAGCGAVVFPYIDGHELLRLRHPQRFVIDFEHDEMDVARAVAPQAFERLQRLALPARKRKAEEEAEANAAALARNPKARVNRHHERFLDRWWQHSYRRKDLLDAIAKSDRYLAVSRVASEERLPVFVFVDSSIHPSDALQCLDFDDEYSFGIVQSGVHEVWLRARCSTLEERLRYTTKTVFHSFPWPQTPSAAQVRAIVDASAAILDHRASRQVDHGLGLLDLYDALRVPGKSTLRGLHGDLDAAVRDAYGFDTSDILQQLLDLNLELAAAEADGDKVRGPGSDWIPSDRKRVTDHRMENA